MEFKSEQLQFEYIKLIADLKALNDCRNDIEMEQRKIKEFFCNNFSANSDLVNDQGRVLAKIKEVTVINGVGEEVKIKSMCLV